MSCVSSSTAGSLPSTVACQECCASFTQQAQTCSSHLETLATEIPIAVSCRQVLLACKQNHKDYMMCLQMIMLQHPSSGAHTTLDTDRHHILCITLFAQNGYVPHGDISATTLLVSSNARPRLLPPGQHPPQLLWFKNQNRHAAAAAIAMISTPSRQQRSRTQLPTATTSA